MLPNGYCDIGIAVQTGVELPPQVTAIEWRKTAHHKEGLLLMGRVPGLVVGMKSQNGPCPLSPVTTARRAAICGLEGQFTTGAMSPMSAWEVGTIRSAYIIAGASTLENWHIGGRTNHWKSSLLESLSPSKRRSIFPRNCGSEIGHSRKRMRMASYS